MAASISSVVGDERDGSAREALYVLFNSRATKLIKTCRSLADVVQPLLMVSDSLQLSDDTHEWPSNTPQNIQSLPELLAPVAVANACGISIIFSE